MSEKTLKLAAYGVDLPTVLERFVDDEELYLHCIDLFIDDKAFPELGYALEAGDYKTAFEKAHSMKGVSSNLGLQPLFETICELVEPLRMGQTEGLDVLYKNVMDGLEKVKELVG